jgi:uncharacterized protein
MRLKVMNRTKGLILADRAQRASTFLQRLVGLLGRAHLPVGEALLIAPCNSVHTFFMRMSIDVAFLDADGVIVKQLDALPPWRATAVYRRARSVLELPAGTLQASGTREGDQLGFDPVEGAP